MAPVFRNINPTGEGRELTDLDNKWVAHGETADVPDDIATGLRAQPLVWEEVKTTAKAKEAN